MAVEKRTAEDYFHRGPQARQVAVDWPALAVASVLDIAHIGRDGAARAVAGEAGTFDAPGWETGRLWQAWHLRGGLHHICTPELGPDEVITWNRIGTEINQCIWWWWDARFGVCFGAR